MNKAKKKSYEDVTMNIKEFMTVHNPTKARLNTYIHIHTYTRTGQKKKGYEDVTMNIKEFMTTLEKLNLYPNPITKTLAGRLFKEVGRL